MSESNEIQQQWHMKKEINIAHLLSTGAMLIAGMMYLTGLDVRITTNETDIKHGQEMRKEDQRRSEKQFDVINKKLDRLLEKQ